MAKRENKNLTIKEIGITLNNAVSAVSQYPALKGLPPLRKKKLMSYASAILEGILEHRKDGGISSEELVLVLASCQLFIHVLLITKGTDSKLAMFQDMAVEMVRE